MATLAERLALLAAALGADVKKLQPFGISLHNTGGLRAVGYGQNVMGYEVPTAMRITSVRYFVESLSTGTGAGNTVAEVHRGITSPAALSGTSGNAAVTSPTAVTGLSIDLAAGDILRCYCSNTGGGTVTGRGLKAEIRGVVIL